ncbi:DUF1800 domain-containing protein [Coraliomargarita akajimensis]|uniref:DUF1800 domain-containing protein n=1 Tax=Coraliomargarita akajimensis (strain DSM 45221 / IAM 15411 / JCM 23193 / KCTC 12865 / 04OKA010-24) TaxID=583355 RepID=D5ER11_CORAD|nr:DUF1800 domain-containing protein [Coraliomargarita akajimensis]ADE54004.1 Protein of unknown function DUF1800 [Coraliomargarita akajimensis DSM 45221]
MFLPGPRRLCACATAVLAPLYCTAETVVLWQDDGNGFHVDNDYTNKDYESSYGGLKTVSAGTIVADPTNGNHGGVHELRMNGDAGTNSTEWGGLRVSSSPYSIGSNRVWDNRIVPGETTFRFTGQFYIPNGTTMAGNDTVYLLLRFFAANGEFSDQQFVGMVSSQYNANDDGYWIYAELEGVVPDVNGLGAPIAEIEPHVPFSDYQSNAGSGVFVYLDNIKLTVDIPAGPTLPPHAVITDPGAFDDDGNGYPDLWEFIYGAASLDPAGDADGDGVSNAKEAEAFTNPLDGHSRLALGLGTDVNGDLELIWPDVDERPFIVEASADLGQTDPWTEVVLSPTVLDGDNYAGIATGDKLFYRAKPTQNDGDADNVPDWMERYFGFSYGSGGSTSSGTSKSYDTTGDGSPDTTLSGDLASLNEIYGAPDSTKQLTEAQAARFLMQSTFGPRYSDIQYLKQVGIEAWIDEQVGLQPTLTRPYIELLKADHEAGELNPANLDPEYGDYPHSDFVRGLNFTTGWARATVGGQDQLRQRVAWSLSQILVASSAATGLGNQPRAVADYYDQFIDEAFGNYEDLLLQVSLHPLMGHYLSSIGNQKADVSIERYPDENYAREIMQLFSIGLWELNLDGTQKLDGQGEPIPTYGNAEITELARVFTGVNFASSNFGGGWKDDGYYMTTPMKLFASDHDFDAKTLVTGHVIPARAATDANALQDVEDAVYHLVRHPNTAPFVCRQLIQFMVTDNPTPAYVERVATVFQNNGSGVVGDMEAVVRAILMDDEARNPLEHLGTEHFGHLREPTIRAMHQARVQQLDRFPNLLWWDWGNYVADSLQNPMGAPSVFNYFRPDFRMRGQIAEKELDSPVFGITDSYAAIAFPNRLWTLTTNGFKYSNYDFPPDWSQLEPLANDIPALLDRTSLLFCAGTLSAGSREILTTVLESTTDTEERIELAVYLTLISPEGACLK